MRELKKRAIIPAMRIFAMTSTADSAEYTRYAIESFLASTTLSADEKLIVIDNDRSSDRITGIGHPAVEVLANDQPKSFAANMNAMLRRAELSKSDLFFLNNDLIFTKGWLEPLLEKDHALVSPLSNRELELRTETMNWTNLLQLSDYIGREKELAYGAELIRARGAHYHRVITLPFFCIRVPYSVYSAVGLLDEEFGRGGAEDNDYCLRCGLQNIPIFYATHSYVLHFSGKSTWAGPESKAETKARCDQFRAVFERKWGQKLLALCIDEQVGIVSDKPELAALVQAGKYKEVIERLKT